MSEDREITGVAINIEALITLFKKVQSSKKPLFVIPYDYCVDYELVRRTGATVVHLDKHEDES